MTGLVRIEKDGRTYFSQRYSFRDDRDRILQGIWEDFEPPYEIIIVPDERFTYVEPKLSKPQAPSHRWAS